MRQRTRGLEKVLYDFTLTQDTVCEPTCKPGAGLINAAPNCTEVEASGDYMEDLIGLSHPWPFKPMIHDEWSWREGTYVGPHHHHGAGGLSWHYYWSNYHYLGSLNYWLGKNINRELLPVAGLSDRDYYSLTRVWEDRIIPRIRPELDLMVFLIELSDIAKLAQSLVRKVTSLPKLLKALGKPGKIKLGVTLNKTLDSISDNWLEYNFALKPTVDDLLGILNGILQFRKKILDLQQGAGKIQKAWGGLTYPYDWTEQDWSVDCGYTCSGCTRASNRRGAYAYIRPVGEMYRRLGITVLYRYKLPDFLEGFSLSVNALLQSIGLVPGLEVIWEIIPFSFVGDWVLPIGDFLSKYRIDPVPVKTEILDICFTQKTYLAAQVLYSPGCETDPVVLGTAERTFVQREVGPEFLTRMPHFQWPNLFQLSLGAALAKTRGRKGKRL